MEDFKPLILYPDTSIALRIFGLFFAGFAVLFVIIPLMLNETEDSIFKIFSFFPFIFVIAGLAFATYRRKITLDKIDRTITKSWGFIVFLSQNTQTLSKVNYVFTTKEVRGSGKHRKTVYPVYIAAENSGNIEIQAHSHDKLSRLNAEKIAKYLEVDIEDVSKGTLRRRKYLDLDRNIKEQIYSNGEKVYQPEKPFDSKVELIEELSDRIILKIPRGAWAWILIIISIVIILFFSFFFLGTGFIGEVIPIPGSAEYIEYEQTPMDVIIPLCFVIPFVAVPAIIFFFGLFKLLPKKLYITAAELKLKSGPFNLFGKSIALDEVEELFYSNRTLYLIGDEKQMKIPSLLNDDDFDYIIQWIKYHIVYGN